MMYLLYISINNYYKILNDIVNEDIGYSYDNLNDLVSVLFKYFNIVSLDDCKLINYSIIASQDKISIISNILERYGVKKNDDVIVNEEMSNLIQKLSQDSKMSIVRLLLMGITTVLPNLDDDEFDDIFNEVEKVVQQYKDKPIVNFIPQTHVDIFNDNQTIISQRNIYEYFKKQLDESPDGRKIVVFLETPFIDIIKYRNVKDVYEHYCSGKYENILITLFLGFWDVLKYYFLNKERFTQSDILLEFHLVFNRKNFLKIYESRIKVQLELYEYLDDINVKIDFDNDQYLKEEVYDIIIEKIPYAISLFDDYKNGDLSNVELVRNIYDILVKNEYFEIFGVLYDLYNNLRYFNHISKKISMNYDYIVSETRELITNKVISKYINTYDLRSNKYFLIFGGSHNFQKWNQYTDLPFYYKRINFVDDDYDYEPYVYEPHKRVRDSIIRFSFDLDDLD